MFIKAVITDGAGLALRTTTEDYEEYRAWSLCTDKQYLAKLASIRND